MKRRVNLLSNETELDPGPSSLNPVCITKEPVLWHDGERLYCQSSWKEMACDRTLQTNLQLKEVNRSDDPGMIPTSQKLKLLRSVEQGSRNPPQ